MTLVELALDPAAPAAVLDQLPSRPAVFALHGADAHAQPYIGRTPNLRGRLARLLIPSERHPRRLQLASRVRRICYQLTGSEFESLLAQYDLVEQAFGEAALKRMHLSAPASIRFLGSNRYPRLSVQQRMPAREPHWSFGPFSSRLAAERATDELLKLFELRRCSEELNPHPDHPGCVYSEMKMCLAPCFRGCTDERYAAEAHAVEQFLASRGQSQLVALRTARDAASAALEFEHAAQLHAEVQRVEAVRALLPELSGPLDQLRLVVLQASSEPESVSVFLFAEGCWRGPAAFSTLGMRIQNEQSGSSSLFSHPVALEPVPEQPVGPVRVARPLLEERMAAVLDELAAVPVTPSAATRQAHLALLRRWYFRPEAKRIGEFALPAADASWPLRALVRAVGRVAARQFTAPAAE